MVQRVIRGSREKERKLFPFPQSSLFDKEKALSCWERDTVIDRQRAIAKSGQVDESSSLGKDWKQS